MASSTARPQVLTPPLTPSPSSKNLRDENVPVDIDIPDNYVHHVLATQKELPPITWKNLYDELQWISVIVLALTPIASIYGWFTTPLQLKTALFSVGYYYFTGLGITAGYHRLWAHRSYNASRPLEYILALAGAGAIEGSIKWWSRGHRAHHRYTDTDLDPYGAHHGLVWSHIGWMIFKPRRKPGVADVSDLTRNPVVRWQHKWFVSLLLLMGIAVPTVIPGYFWGDWRGGYFYAALTRLLFVHHVSTLYWLYEQLDSPFFPSRPSVSTRSLTGLVKLPSTTSTLPAITCSPRLSLSERVTTTSTTSSPWTTATPSSGTSMTQPSGSSQP